MLHSTLGCTHTFPFCVVLCGSVVGGFKHFLFSPRGNDPIWRSYFPEWVGSTTNYFSCCIVFVMFFFFPVLHCHPSIFGGLVLPRCLIPGTCGTLEGRRLSDHTGVTTLKAPMCPGFKSCENRGQEFLQRFFCRFFVYNLLLRWLLLEVVETMSWWSWLSTLYLSSTIMLFWQPVSKTGEFQERRGIMYVF